MGIRRRGGFSLSRSRAPTRPPVHYAPHPSFRQQPPVPVQMNAHPRAGLMSNIASGIFQGMTFGAGSAVGHRIVDGIAGPETIRHEFVNDPQQQEQQQQYQQIPQQQFDQYQYQQQEQQQRGPCAVQLQTFQRCVETNSVDACSTYLTQLQQCQRENNI